MHACSRWRTIRNQAKQAWHWLLLSMTMSDNIETCVLPYAAAGALPALSHVPTDSCWQRIRTCDRHVVWTGHIDLTPWLDVSLCFQNNL